MPFITVSVLLAPQCLRSLPALSVDTGDEIGVTLYLQPLLPSPNPPHTYATEKVRRWWVKMDDITVVTLNCALDEIKVLYGCKNTFSLHYF